jgi:hypothetical protein
MDGSASGMVAAHRAARQRIVELFERAGATSPVAARPLGSLGEPDDAALRACLDDGTVREGAPGTFYLYVRPTAPGRDRARVARTIIFWILVLLLPIALIQLLSR